jgi:hypothetical protein
VIRVADVVQVVFARVPDFRAELVDDPFVFDDQLSDPYVVLEQLAIWANNAAIDGEAHRVDVAVPLIDELATSALTERAMWDLVLLQLADGFPWDERLRERFSPATQKLFADDDAGTARFPGD